MKKRIALLQNNNKRLVSSKKKIMEINNPLGDIYMKMWMIMRHYVYFWNKFHKFRFCFYTFFNSADLKIDSLGISFPLLTIIFFFFFFHLCLCRTALVILKNCFFGLCNTICINKYQSRIIITNCSSTKRVVQNLPLYLHCGKTSGIPKKFRKKCFSYKNAWRGQKVI